MRKTIIATDKSRNLQADSFRKIEPTLIAIISKNMKNTKVSLIRATSTAKGTVALYKVSGTPTDATLLVMHTQMERETLNHNKDYQFELEAESGVVTLQLRAHEKTHASSKFSTLGQVKTGYKVGGTITTSKIKWAEITDIDANKRMLYVCDEDGKEIAVPFNSVMSYKSKK